MHPRTPLVLLSLTLLLAPFTALAQTSDVSVDVEGVAQGGPVGNVTPGEEILVFANVTVPEGNDTAWRAFLNGTIAGTTVGNVTQQTTDKGSLGLFFQASAPNTTGTHSIDWTVTVQSKNLTSPSPSGNQTDGNGTGSNGTADDGNATATWETATIEQGQVTFTVEDLAPPPQPGLPWGWILGIGAVVVAGGGAAYWWTNRDVQIRGQARSQAMQELDGGSFEQPAQAEPEVHPQLKILEARADDVRRMIDLAKDRYERGDLTEHQYNTIRDRKETELEEIQAEMDEYRE